MRTMNSSATTTAVWAQGQLVTLNFSQPQGTPTDGIVQSVQHGKYLKVDFEDCALMGYKVFGVKVEKGTEDQIDYSTKGKCQAYVQFQQGVPEGFERLGQCPVELFAQITAPRVTSAPGAGALGSRSDSEFAP